jgi:hypothetical protein
VSVNAPPHVHLSLPDGRVVPFTEVTLADLAALAAANPTATAQVPLAAATLPRVRAAPRGPRGMDAWPLDRSADLDVATAARIAVRLADDLAPDAPWATDEPEPVLPWPTTPSR